MNESPDLLRTPPQALLRVDDPPAGHPGGWLRFRRPAAVLHAEAPGEVPEVLARVEAAAESDGRWAVGFVAYEAAPGFDPALVTRPLPAGVPAAWFALFDDPERVGEPEADEGGAAALVERLAATVPDDDYRAKIATVREAIARGDTYQANFTYRLRGALTGDRAAPELFARLHRVQPAPYAAYLELAGAGGAPAAVCSASPELFFRREGGRIVCRPMKGTAPRGRTLAEDRRAREALRTSPKERAENLMIVDMVRNDLGRIARPGSVRVPSLFDVERYETVHQMTSTVEAESDAPLLELFAALFPCASVTGAPKVRTMEILTELEGTPRGVYTGAVGWVAPGGTARFSVAIRTAWVASGAGGRTAIEYGTGGGVVWDSDPERELEETRTTALALRQALGARAPRDDFGLLETLLLTRDRGYVLLDRHLDRLAGSAEYFGFAVDREAARRALESVAIGDGGERWRVRLLADRRGRCRVEATRLPDEGFGGVGDPGGALVGPAPTGSPLRVALAPGPVDSSDRFLFHKTTRRQVYERALRDARRTVGDGGPIDDAILWNERGELTESTIANLVLELDGERVTPPVGCGLLAGTLRAELLAHGAIRERVLTAEDLERAEAVFLVSSVRGWVPAELVPAPGEPPSAGRNR